MRKTLSPLLKDLTGQRFTRLVAIRVAERGDHVKWLCRCDCGQERKVEGFALRSGHTRSCGCLQREEVSKYTSKHGWARDNAPHHPLYTVWQSMRNRCQNPRFVDYHNYGGRGIRVDDVWNDFERFRSDMEPTWKPGLMLDRKDNDGPYSPWNCRWATRAEQMSNTRRNRRVVYMGRNQTITQWATEFGLTHKVLSYRLKAGWTLWKALTSPVARKVRSNRVKIVSEKACTATLRPV